MNTKSTIKLTTMYYQMKHLSYFLLLFLFATACEDDDDDELLGNWIEMSDFEGVPRSDAALFTIGTKAYVCTGYDDEDERRNDAWVYDSEINNWDTIADFPGVARNSAVAFSIGDKGYLGTGYDGDNKLKDFWEYDPSTNTWTQKADFAGSARYGAVAFSVDGKGYIGTGYDGHMLKDFYAYSPGTDTWEKIISIPGSKRMDAVSFVIDDKAYVATGIDNGTYENDFFEYDPETLSWTEKREISNISDDDYDDDYSIVRIEAVAFSVGNFGYIATSGAGSVGTDVWQYDVANDLWEEKTGLEASARMEAVGFAIGNRGYVVSGRSSSYYFDDLWAFDPFDEQVDYD